MLHMDRKLFNETKGEAILKQLVCPVDSNGVDVMVSSKYLCMASVAALVHHMEEVHDVVYMPHSLRVEFRTGDGLLLLDPLTVKCLELLEPNTSRSIFPSNKPPKAIKSLYDVLKHTQTVQGARLLKANLLQPPSELNTILLRQSTVLELLTHEELYFAVSHALLAFHDTDPILSLIIRASAAPTTHPAKSSTKDSLVTAQHRIATLVKLQKSLAGVQTLLQVVSTSSHPFFAALQQTLSHPDLSLICKLLDDTMSDVASGRNTTGPAPKLPKKNLQERDVIFAIKDGINGLLDVARKVYGERTNDIKEVFEGYCAEFAELGLSLVHNASRGYFLRISLDKQAKKKETAAPSARGFEIDDDDVEEMEPVQTAAPRKLASIVLPDMFILRTHKARCIEFTTEDLVALNARLDGSKNEILLLTAKLLEGVQAEICNKIGCIYKLDESISLLDLILSFATFVTLSPEPCCRPEFNDKGTFAVVRSFHPLLLAQATPEHPAIPNDIKSSKTGSFVHFITGKNNSGKTTYLLQIATVTLLAHMGCFLPAKFVSISLVDRILTRIAHTDHEIATSDAAASSSAFFNEMKEVAYILNSASARSLILVDELGKTTSSDEAVPLCFAISENLIERKITTFFATHWLDMVSKLHDMYPQVLVHRMLVNSSTSTSADAARNQGMAEGCEVDSGYGIDLAASSGWPRDVIDMARQYRNSMNTGEQSSGGLARQHSVDTQIRRLKEAVVEQLRIVKFASLDAVDLQVFLNKLAMNYRKKLDELQEPTIRLWEQQAFEEFGP